MSDEQRPKPKRGRPPKNNETSPQKLQMIADTERAWELRAQGKTYREIAMIMEIPRTTALQYIQRKIGHHTSRTEINRQDYVDTQLDDIEGALKELWIQLRTLPYAKAGDKTITITEKVAIANARANLTRAIETMLNRQAKLLGLDMPTQVEDVTPRETPYIVIGVDISKPPHDDQ